MFWFFVLEACGTEPIALALKGRVLFTGSPAIKYFFVKVCTLLFRHNSIAYLIACSMV